jgi:hypothetical protein
MRERVADAIVVNVLQHSRVATVVCLAPEIVDLSQLGVANPFDCCEHLAIDVCPCLSAAIAVEIRKAVISRVKTVPIHQNAIVRTRPLDLVEHLLRIYEELVVWSIQVHGDNIDWTALAIADNSRGLETAARAVEVVGKMGRGNLYEDNIRLNAPKDCL